MKQGHIQLVDLEFEYKIWKKRLDLYLSELHAFALRKEEFALLRRTLKPTVDCEIQCAEHRKNLEQLYNRIKVQEQELQFYNKDFPITDSHPYFMVHVDLREHMQRITPDHFQLADEVIDWLTIE